MMGNLYFLGDKFITINIDNITFWGNQFKPQQIDDIQEAVSNSMERDNSYILRESFKTLKMQTFTCLREISL